MPPNSSPAAAAVTASNAFSVSLTSALSAASSSSVPSTLTSSSAFASAATKVIDAAQKPVVRLYSIQNAPPKSKTLHLIRHAEGTHNISPESHKTPLHWDARLTEKGMEQCRKLARKTSYHYQRRVSLNSEADGPVVEEQDDDDDDDMNSDIHPSVGEVEAVIVSPMSRCLQTAILSFPHHYAGSTNNNTSDVAPVPFIAHESWRETTNFLCDSRRSISELRKDFPLVDFDTISHEDDPIWAKYEAIFGAHDEFEGLRESKDGENLAQRAQEAWRWLASRPEKNLAICGHSAFFMHQFQPYLPEMMGVVSYEDEEVERLMTDRGFANCELRTVAFQTDGMTKGE